jgi:thymidylate kinase
VALLGLDGSGKSTVLKRLEEEFSSSLFAGLKVIYRRPNLSGQTLQNGGPLIDHYAAPPYGAVKSVAKLGLRALDWWLGYWGRVATPRAQGYLVLLDRHYFIDMSIDPLRYRYNGPLWLARWVALLLPRPDLFILLDAPVEVLQSRKQEVTPEEAARQREAYLKLIQILPNSYVVDASEPLDQVVTNVEQIILNYSLPQRQTPETAVPS